MRQDILNYKATAFFAKVSEIQFHQERPEATSRGLVRVMQRGILR